MDVKDKLLAYRQAQRYVDACAEMLTQARADALKSPNMDGMPRTPGVHGLDTMMARIDALERKLVRAQNKAKKVLKDVTDMIQLIDNYDQKTVLILRYVTGRNWEEIAERMGYSRRSVIYMHGDALQRLRDEWHETS